MSDKESEQHLDEEYHFTEEPDLDMPPVDDHQDQNANQDPLANGSRPFNIEKVKDFFYDNTPARNLVVVVGLLLVLYVAYKIFSGLFTGGHQELTKQVTKPVTTTVVAPKPMVISDSKTDILNDIDAVKSRLNTVEQNQTTMQSQLSSMSQQLSATNDHINQLSDKLTQLSEQLVQLKVMLENQPKKVEVYRELPRPKPRPVRHIYREPPVIYFLKAVIPGRAWLMATNGATLTVRVGSVIPGYGVVRYIDSIQGRVLTSSGQLIRFSQDDS